MPPTQGGEYLPKELFIHRKFAKIWGFIFNLKDFLGSATIIGPNFPLSLSNHVGTAPRLLIYPLGTVTHLKTGWAQDAWLQWTYENWYIHLDTSRWQNMRIFGKFWPLFVRSLCLVWKKRERIFCRKIIFFRPELRLRLSRESAHRHQLLGARRSQRGQEGLRHHEEGLHRDPGHLREVPWRK